ncbi:NrsF family protein [uncultured Bradyrhizobium sp.]|uniref:NrsF family protein n=1 Tax=uncultured Bradyrhizobium sp. TaxID=199684 RepID=UPI002608F79E|nr:NrsF family protein [uncultured Bradyrhizobium sp.]
MKTNDLIDMLGTNVEPVAGGERRQALLAALGLGAAAALCLIFAIFGVPGEAFGGNFLGLTILTLAYMLGLAAVGARFLSMAARPGNAGRGAGPPGNGGSVGNAGRAGALLTIAATGTTGTGICPG